MTELNDQDWVLLGAYLDDELTPEERADFARRLEREQPLARALDDMGGLKRDLGALRPARSAANSSSAPIGRWASAGALAAGLALVAFLGVELFDRTPSPAEIHASFLAEDMTSLPDAHRVASLSPQSRLPDLGVAGLAVVFERKVGGGVAGHYVGPNGCRLTLIVGDAPIDEAGTTSMQAGWRSGSAHYAMVARDMDPRRFDAIAAYLRDGAGSGGGTVLAGRLQTARACG